MRRVGPYKRHREHALSGCHVWSEDKGCPLSTRKEGLIRTQLLLDLSLSASGTVRQCLLFEFPVLWHFVMVARAGQLFIVIAKYLR